MTERKRDAPIIREFIYLDVERVKSALAQIDEGVTDQVSTLSGDSESTSTSGKAGLPGVASLEHMGSTVTSTSTTESTTLHDFLYNTLENRLLQQDFLVESASIDDQGISPVDFVLAEGRIAFNDYGYMANMVEQLEQLSERLARLQVIEEWTTAKTPKVRKDILDDAAKSGRRNSLPKWFNEDLAAILRSFYGSAQIIRCSADTLLGTLQFTGPLALKWLRDSPEDLRFKYGLRPSGTWHLLGQVTRVPWKDSIETNNLNLVGGELQTILDNAFVALEEVRESFNDAPEVKVTPIALFRERKLE